MLNIDKLMEMKMEEVDAKEEMLIEEWEEKMEQKCDVEKYYDLRDDYAWELYEGIMQDIDYIEKNLEVIKDYKKNYDYYWDEIE